MARLKTNTDPIAPAATAPGASAALVTVAYNSPRGMRFDNINGKSIHIRGNAEHLRGEEMGVIPVGRYGYTRVPAEDWAAIVKAYGSMAVIKNGLMFAEKSGERAEDRAEEQKELRHGLEPPDTSATATKEVVAPGQE